MQKQLKFFKSSEELISMVLGLMIVILAGWLAFSYFQKRTSGDVAVPGITDESGNVAQNLTPGAIVETEVLEIPSKGPIDSKNQAITTPSRTYVVVKGDSLWKIAQKEYGSGYNWIDIAKTNKLNNPGAIAVGQKLNLPGTEKRELVVVQGQDKIEAGEYTVKKGDSLSKIALRAYGDKFAWTVIWEANKSVVSHPSRIYSGTKLTIPRTDGKGGITSIGNVLTK